MDFVLVFALIWSLLHGPVAVNATQAGGPLSSKLHVCGFSGGGPL